MQTRPHFDGKFSHRLGTNNIRFFQLDVEIMTGMYIRPLPTLITIPALIPLSL